MNVILKSLLSSWEGRNKNIAFLGITYEISDYKSGQVNKTFRWFIMEVSPVLFRKAEQEIKKTIRNDDGKL